LRFLTFVYNASGSSAVANPTSATPGTPERPNNVPASSTIPLDTGPDLAVQIQLFRDDEPVITMPLHQIQIDSHSDRRRVPYAAELNLEGLRAGRYVLLVTVIDRVAKASAPKSLVSG